MTLAPSMISVVPLESYTVRCRFADGEVRDVDTAPLLDRGGFRVLRDPVRFTEDFLDEDSHTLAWPGGVDLDREVIYGVYPSASTPCARVSTPQRV